MEIWVEVQPREHSSVLICERVNRNQIQGFPGAIHVPVLSQLFSGNNKTSDQTDIVMLLTPHIVRTHELTAEDLAPIYIGTQQNVGERRMSHRCITLPLGAIRIPLNQTLGGSERGPQGAEGSAPVAVGVAQRLIREGTTASAAAEGARVLRQAIGLWRGRPLAELAGWRWFDEQAWWLESLRAQATRAGTALQRLFGDPERLPGG